MGLCVGRLGGVEVSGFDKWVRWHDGTLRNELGNIAITRVQERKRDKPRWRVDGWRNERVPEFPDDVAEGWKRVQFTLGEFDTLRRAKSAVEMHFRSRDGGKPRGTRSDWRKVERELRERIDLLAYQVREGFWEDVLVGHRPEFGEFGWELYVTENDMELELRDLAENLLSVAESGRARRSLEARIAKLESVEGRTPEEAALYLAKAAELRGAAT
jgi:hypothetical protein